MLSRDRRAKPSSWGKESWELFHTLLASITSKLIQTLIPFPLKLFSPWKKKDPTYTCLNRLVILHKRTWYKPYYIGTYWQHLQIIHTTLRPQPSVSALFCLTLQTSYTCINGRNIGNSIMKMSIPWEAQGEAAMLLEESLRSPVLLRPSVEKSGGFLNSFICNNERNN